MEKAKTRSETLSELFEILRELDISLTSSKAKAYWYDFKTYEVSQKMRDKLEKSNKSWFKQSDKTLSQFVNYLKTKTN